jgi:hypothetical protein
MSVIPDTIIKTTQISSRETRTIKLNLEGTKIVSLFYCSGIQKSGFNWTKQRVPSTDIYQGEL